MKALMRVIGVFLIIMGLAWLPASFWIALGDPWCLNVFPEWLDKQIFSIAQPYLAKDMIHAAEQMDFLEVWISSFIIMELVFLPLYFVWRKKFYGGTLDDLFISPTGTKPTHQ